MNNDLTMYRYVWKYFIIYAFLEWKRTNSPRVSVVLDRSKHWPVCNLKDRNVWLKRLYFIVLFIIDNTTIKYHLHTYITVACCLRASMIVKVKITRLQLILNKPQLLRINFGYLCRCIYVVLYLLKKLFSEENLY